MKIKVRLSILCTAVFAVVFICCSVFIFLTYHKGLEQMAYKSLETKAMISAFFYLEEDELSSADFERIKNQFNSFVPANSFQIYNDSDSLYYGKNNLHFDENILQDIKENRKLRFKFDKHLCYGIYYEDNVGDFIIITSEDESDIQNQISLLTKYLTLSFMFGLILVALLSLWISNLAYKPFRRVIGEVKNISTNNLDVQIKVPNTKDELQDLVETFNVLLQKISETINIQRNFVSYVSHEFKTPLASVMGNLEVFSLKERSPEEYNTLANRLIKDIDYLRKILDTLLVLSDLRTQASFDNTTRVDEVIWSTISALKHKYSEAKVQVNMNLDPDDLDLLLVPIDETQLNMVFTNILDNAIKYSNNKTAKLTLSKQEDKLSITIEDKGIGIPQNQIDQLSKPFFRATNVGQHTGFGIGLSVAFRILQQNHIHYTIDSKENQGTTITLLFNPSK